MAKYFGPKETEVISRLSYEKVTLITKEQFDKLFGESLLTEITTSPNAWHWGIRVCPAKQDKMFLVRRGEAEHLG